MEVRRPGDSLAGGGVDSPGWKGVELPKTYKFEPRIKIALIYDGGLCLITTGEREGISSHCWRPVASPLPRRRRMGRRRMGRWTDRPLSNRCSIQVRDSCSNGPSNYDLFL